MQTSPAGGWTCPAPSRVLMADGSITYTPTSIGDYAFYNCEKLTSVALPGSLTSIGEDAFYGCSRLAKLVMLAESSPRPGRSGPE